MQKRKGIILAGGTGSRLFPATMATSKQLMPVYDKPMIYHPLDTLMAAGIREVALITAPDQVANFRTLLGDGSRIGLSIDYLVQPSPDGLAQAYLLAEDWLAGAPSAMILGDNLFHGSDFEARLCVAESRGEPTIFTYPVEDPGQFGVIGFDAKGRASSLEEKPAVPKSRFAATGLYFLDADASRRARDLTPSARGELEITDLLRTYLDEGRLNVECLDAVTLWFDTGTHEALFRTTRAVRQLARNGIHAGAIEARAFHLGLIGRGELLAIAARLANTEYGKHLQRVALGLDAPLETSLRSIA